MTAFRRLKTPCSEASTADLERGAFVWFGDYKEGCLRASFYRFGASWLFFSGSSLSIRRGRISFQRCQLDLPMFSGGPFIFQGRSSNGKHIGLIRYYSNDIGLFLEKKKYLGKQMFFTAARWYTSKELITHKRAVPVSICRNCLEWSGKVLRMRNMSPQIC